VLPDLRHAPVRAAIAESYASANDGLAVPWSGHTARVLADFLATNKTWPGDRLCQCVRNRFASDGINPAEDPIRWIRRLPNYARGPLDRFGRPKQASKTQEELLAEYWESKRVKGKG
jgi:hypothetical protein